MSYVNRFLRSQGVGTPYQDDRTKAQIDEANKSNPLSGYGFLSATQKKQRDMQVKLFEEQQRREQEALQQQLIARMSSQEKIGHYAGGGLMNLVGMLKSRGSAPELPEAPPTNDPELDRFNQLAQEVGQEGALEIVGRETGNSAMIEQAQQMRMAKSKEALEMRNTQSLISDREKVKPNTVITTQGTGPDGRPLQVSKEVLGVDPITGQNKYKELGSAVKGSLTVDDPSKFSTSKGGIETRTKAMESAITSTANALDVYDRLEKLAQDAPAGLAWTGQLASKADSAISGIQNLATAMVTAEGREVTASLDVGKYDWGRLEKVAASSDKIKSLVLQLAYAQAAATGDSSRSLSDRDIQNQIDQIGGGITNPKSFLELTKQNKELLISKLDNMAQYTRIDGKPIYSAYRQDIDGLRSRVGMPARVGTVTMYRGGKKYNIPQEQVEAFKAAGGSESQ